MIHGKSILVGLICITTPSIKVEATHALGANIAYNWVVGNQYEINVNYYRDCFGIPAPDSISVCINSISSSYSDSVKLPLVGALILPQLPYLPPVISACYGGTGFGIEKNLYSAMIILPAVADDWIISYTTPVHLSSGSQDPERYGYYVHTKIDNINYPQNSSVQFIPDPKFIYCFNEPTWDSYLANDINGDSLIYSIENVFLDTLICPPQPFVNSNVSLNNYFQQLSSLVPYYLHPTDGWLYFHPNVPQMGYFSIKVEEVSNGLIINETTFSHFQSAVFNCTSTNVNDQIASISSIKLFPTVVADKLYVNTDNINSEIEICIYDSYGKVVINFTIDGNIKEHRINLEFLSQGLYYVNLNSTNHFNIRNNFKIIKTNH